MLDIAAVKCRHQFAEPLSHAALPERLLTPLPCRIKLRTFSQIPASANFRTSFSRCITRATLDPFPPQGKTAWFFSAPRYCDRQASVQPVGDRIGGRICLEEHRCRLWKIELMEDNVRHSTPSMPHHTSRTSLQHWSVKHHPFISALHTVCSPLAPLDCRFFIACFR